MVGRGGAAAKVQGRVMTRVGVTWTQARCCDVYRVLCQRNTSVSLLHTSKMPSCLNLLIILCLRFEYFTNEL